MTLYELKQISVLDKFNFKTLKYTQLVRLKNEIVSSAYIFQEYYYNVKLYVIVRNIMPYEEGITFNIIYIIIYIIYYIIKYYLTLCTPLFTLLQTCMYMGHKRLHSVKNSLKIENCKTKSVKYVHNAIMYIVVEITNTFIRLVFWSCTMKNVTFSRFSEGNIFRLSSNNTM